MMVRYFHKEISLLQIDRQTKLIDVLRIFQSKPVSALPVVDSAKRLQDVYSKFDIMVCEKHVRFFDEKFPFSFSIWQQRVPMQILMYLYAIFSIQFMIVQHIN